MNICFLTTDKVNVKKTDDLLIAEMLEHDGHQISWTNWKSETKWEQFDRVIIRSTWDYHLAPDQFLRKLSKIEEETILYNPIQLVQWNHRKTYLLDLADQHLPTVPSLVSNELTEYLLLSYFDLWQTDQLVIKPIVSASAYHTYKIQPSEVKHFLNQIKEFPLEWIIQPFLPEIQSSGEVSLMFANCQFTHAIRKIPKKGDFRVQEELGGENQLYSPGEQLLELADEILNSLTTLPLYARIDLLPTLSGPLVMEVELIEPSLYLKYFPQGAKAFAEAIVSSDRLG